MLNRGTNRKKLRKTGLFGEKHLKKAVTIVFNIIQPVMVLAALSVISFVVYLWFTHLLILSKAKLNDIDWVIKTLLGIWLLFNVAFNYLSAVFVYAGDSYDLFPAQHPAHQYNNNTHTNGMLQIQVLTPLIQANASSSSSNASECMTDDEQLRQFIRIKNEQIMKDYFFGENMGTLQQIRGMRNNPYLWRFCEDCNAPKPPRAHHCSICHRCILNMDHHCPWVAGCVGLCNYRYFVLFMFWVCVGALFFIANAFPYAGLNFYVIKSAYSRHSFRGDPVLRTSQSRILLGCIFCLAVTFAVGCLLVFHLFLVLKGNSTIELFSTSKFTAYFKKKGVAWKAPSNHGMKKNWQFVFRTYGKFWWLTWCCPLLPNRQEILKEIMADNSASN
eukprot:CAMPEP_0202693058 /NCGR_PEP_ID=MMETSP1385-20130828/7281_1 /ASSEMBLY_ACC=CAM_ASM_000861 /TAXON_ID=933848 /ORGANISM="Elphidium margaritaceum" /LENGTH=386 /DNA_ID=CAMNT_0049348693 /DNA_START=20 /DNA_END=1180 /DNA_ORIENTATION=-